MTTVDRQPSAPPRAEFEPTSTGEGPTRGRDSAPVARESSAAKRESGLLARGSGEPASDSGDSPHAIKRARVLAIARERGAERVVLSSPGATSWYLDGARTHVSLAGGAILAIVVSEAGDSIRVHQNEFDRIGGEELGEGFAAGLLPVPWHLGLTDGVGPAGTLFEEAAERELRLARAALLPHEQERYAELGADIARVFTATLSRASPRDSERAIAAELARGIVAVGADPIVILTSGEGRLHHRHPLPTDAPLGQRAMAVIGARRGGLMVSATRWVSFRPLTPAERDRQCALREVEGAFLEASRPGASLDAAFASGIAAYAAHGFEAEEWHRHHQGGPTGYFGRDPKASPITRELIVDQQAFAWNPSVAADKVEDTMILSGGVSRVLTHDPAWPSVLHGGVPRAATLELG